MYLLVLLTCIATSASPLVQAAPTTSAAAAAPAKVVLVSTYTDLQAQLQQHGQQPSDSVLYLDVTKDIAISATLTVDTKQSIVVRGATPPGDPPVLSCLHNSGAFSLLGGGQLTLVNVIVAQCNGPAVLHATGAGSRLSLDGVTMTKSGSSQAGSTLVHVEGGAGLSINSTRFQDNVGVAGTPLLRVELAPRGVFQMDRTSFTDNQAAQLLLIQNTGSVVFDNATLVAIATGDDHDRGWSHHGDVSTGKAMATATISSTDFTGNTIVDGGELLRSNGTAVTFRECTWANNTGFSRLVSLNNGAADFTFCRFTSNTGSSWGTPSLLSIFQGGGLTFLENCTMSGNNNTGGIFHTGFTHWIYRNTSTSKVKWSNSTEQGTDFDRAWSVNDLNRTLQGTYYDGSRFNELWQDTKTTYKERWNKIASINNILFYERSHHSPLLVRDSEFSGNRFTWGGILNLNSNAENGTSMFLDNVQFINNSVAYPPGYNSSFYQPPAVLSLFAATLRLCNLTLSGNSGVHIVHMQRAVVNMTTCHLRNNAARAFGKVLHLSNGTAQVMTDIDFENNTGGEIAQVLQSSVILDRWTVAGNSAANNVITFASVNALTMSRTTLRDNTAAVGSIFLMNFTVYGVWKHAAFQSNRAGSSILLIEQPYSLLDTMKMRDSSFVGNTVDLRNATRNRVDQGDRGGALVVNGNNPSSQFLDIHLTSMQFTNNTVLSGRGAPGYGGALRTSAQLKSISLANCSFSGNSAADGGAVHLNCPAAIAGSNFTHNEAAGRGGAIAAVNWTALIIRTSEFRHNRAVVGGAVLIAPAAAPPDVLINPFDAYSSFTNSVFVNNSARVANSLAAAAAAPAGQGPCLPGGGGAICLRPKGSQMFNITGNTIASNAAEWGGALFVDDLDYASLLGKPPAGPGAAVVYMCGNNVAGNTGGAYGGQTAYYSLTPAIVAIDCSLKGPNCTRGPIKQPSSRGDPSCPIPTETAGAGVATGVVSVDFTDGVLHTANNTTPIIRSGATIDSALQFKDAFGDVLTTLPPYSVNIDIEYYDKKRLVVFGNLGGAATVTNGTASFKDIYLQPNLYTPNNSVYTFNLTVTGSHTIERPVSIIIRNCNIGERLTDTYSCLPCRNNTFSNDPALGSCAPCPVGGDCTTGMLLPKKAFWQSHPQSPQVHHCPLSNSCTGNTTDLGAFMNETASPALFQAWLNRTQNPAAWEFYRQNVTRAYRERQCAKGHTGNLCGICKGPKYGRFGFSCIKCLPIKLNNALIFLSVVLLAVILACTVFSHLRGSAQLAAAVGTETLKSAHTGSAREELPTSGLRPSQEATLYNSAQSFSDPQLTTAQISDTSGSSQLRQRGKAGGGPNASDAAMAPDKGLPELTLCPSPTAAPPPSRSSFRRGGTKAKEFLTVSKIFVSYVQVVGIMRTLQLDWPPALQRMVNSVDVSSTSNYISVECSLGRMDSLKKAVVQTSAIVMLPVLAVVAAALFWLLFGLVGNLIRKRPLGWSGETPLGYFYHRMVLTTVQICYYLYPLVSMAIFQIFTWTRIDDQSDDDIAQQYFKRDSSYILSGRFWTQHVDTRYFEGTHRTLALALGVPGLVLFALGFPLVSALQLWWNRNHLNIPEVVLLYGFLYEEYQDQYYAWEAVIMLRKAALLACAVFLRPFGAAVQLLTPNIILAACIFVQGKYEPFQEPRMNGLESVSLFSTQVTLLGFGFFLPQSSVQTRHAFRFALAIILAVMNVLVVLYFAYHVLHVARAMIVSVSMESMLGCLHKGGDQYCGCWTKMSPEAAGKEAGKTAGLQESKQPC